MQSGASSQRFGGRTGHTKNAQSGCRDKRWRPLDCLQLALKWDAAVLKQASIARQAKMIHGANIMKVLEIAQTYGCEELIQACSKIKPKEGEGAGPGVVLTSVAKLEIKVNTLEDKIEKKFAELGNKIDTLFEIMIKLEPKEEQQGKTRRMEEVENNQGRLLKEWIKLNKLAKVRLVLLYQGSRDGYTASVFRNKCDNMGPTVTVIESHLGKVFGGFTLVA
eukprot:TRINITY_DN3567_c0_g1_i2.p1 TRINITY_DN3567_c0_g1~~TRINITY_DN3567_c0_g1_i2.p1  ORF type:complete len:221 (-),score=12.43 TRINITY_DN3567_c0_g1_i2:481-1143(-)